MDVSEIGLSPNGEKILKENGVTCDMVKAFTEADIEDLFKESFKDRFCIRQYVKRHTASAHVQDKPSSSSAIPHAVIEHEIDANNGEPDEPRPDQLDSSRSEKPAMHGFNPMDMLRKKDKRGKPSPAQKYFTGLIRDAAKAAKLWKRAAPVNEQFSQKKEDFLSRMFQTCPNLIPYRREVTRRLIDALQNRRKYLSDKSTGKRKSKAFVSPTPTRMHEAGKLSSQSEIYKGNTVKILTQKEVIGKGIYSGHCEQQMNSEEQVGQQFCEVIVTAVLPRAEELNVELPKQTCDGETVFTKNLLKKIITWRADRIEPDVPRTAARSTSASGHGSASGSASTTKSGSASSSCTTSGSNSVSSDHQELSATKSSYEIGNGSSNRSTADKSCTSASKSSVARKKIKLTTDDHDSDLSTSGSEQEMPKLYSRKSSNDRMKRKVSTPNRSRSSNSIAESMSASSSSRSRACLYEWSGGKVYLGALIDDDKGPYVINCMRPIGKIDHNGEVVLNEKDLQTTVLNKLDQQTNPNNSYQICVLSSCSVKLHEKSGHVIGGHIIIPDVTRMKLKGIIQHYVQSKY